ncbi:MAG TPA: alpha/beta hydrolase [Chitinophagaceae bacterium]|nr:alpha/beta hydrolase [Chitinophagaceae bacterium]
MNTIVLVHGAFAGKYAWELVKPMLEKAGHKVVTFDLPAHGDDTTAPQNATFESYVNTVVQAINAEPGKVILVGHSMGGVVISAVAENIPAKIEKLIYLSAYIPKSGQSLQELAGIDAESLIGANLKFVPDYSGAYLPDDITEKVFAGDCTEDIKKLVVEKSKGKLEPLAAFQAKPLLTEEQFGSVAKYYIETLNDEGVSNKLQKQMVKDNGTIKKVYSLQCSHSAYFAKPDELAAILLELSAE